jgi:hypothetical protein
VRYSRFFFSLESRSPQSPASDNLLCDAAALDPAALLSGLLFTLFCRMSAACQFANQEENP